MACLVREYNVTPETQRNHPLHAYGLRAIHSIALYFSITCRIVGNYAPLCALHDARLRAVSIARL
jgi:hypothetical protein